MNAKSTLSYKYIFRFWLPLAATWLMMSVEGPLIAAIIARMAEPKLNLAAYGVAFAFALIIEAPVIMILSAATALVQNPQSYLKLLRYTNFLNAVITVTMLILLIPSVFHLVFIQILELPPDVVKLTHWALLILIVWPGAIGYRRFYQGVMIRFGFTRRVAYGTIIRLTFMSLTAFILYKTEPVNGAYVGAAALSVGVLMEAIASRIMAHDALKILFFQKNNTTDEKELTYSGITRFYYPLILTSFLGLVIQPALTFFMGQSRFALESLAVWPVVNSFIFIFRSMGLSYQEVAIALMGKREENYHRLKRFSQMIAAGASGILLVIAFTPLLLVWLQDISGLKPELASFAYLPVQILILMPAMSVWLSWQRAILVNRRHTSPVTIATSIELIVVVLLMSVLVFYSAFTGVTAAAIALLAGRAGANGYLSMKTK